jgi:hypothetical protein
MILFKLRCAADHEFEGWFRDNAAYDRQHSRGLISCPECSTNSVEKALMAPRLGRSHKAAPEASPPEPAAAPAPPPAEASPPSPAQLRRALQMLRNHVETHCEDVGKGFAAEARRIHNGEARVRGIYGEADPAEAKALTEEGIEIASIPWLPPNDA